MSNIDKILPSNNDVFDPMKTFEIFGYTNVRRASDLEKGNHQIFYGKKNGIECVLKFIDITDDIVVNQKVLAKEEYCYKHLPKKYLLDLMEINFDYKFLATKRWDLLNIHIDKETINDIISLRLETLSQIAADGLPEVNWEHYLKIFNFLFELEKLGIIKNANGIVGIFQENRDLIMNYTKGFSHGDFSLRNIKKHDNNLVVYDFEYACQENPMFDLATFYAEIKGDSVNEEYFMEKANNYLLFNKKLFDLMKIRRSVLLLYAFRKRESSHPVRQKYEPVFNDAASDLLNEDK